MPAQPLGGGAQHPRRERAGAALHREAARGQRRPAGHQRDPARRLHQGEQGLPAHLQQRPGPQWQFNRGELEGGAAGADRGSRGGSRLLQSRLPAHTHRRRQTDRHLHRWLGVPSRSARHRCRAAHGPAAQRPVPLLGPQLGRRGGGHPYSPEPPGAQWPGDGCGADLCQQTGVLQRALVAPVAPGSAPQATPADAPGSPAGQQFPAAHGLSRQPFRGDLAGHGPAVLPGPGLTAGHRFP